MIKAFLRFDHINYYLSFWEKKPFRFNWNSERSKFFNTSYLLITLLFYLKKQLNRSVSEVNRGLTFLFRSKFCEQNMPHVDKGGIWNRWTDERDDVNKLLFLILIYMYIIYLYICVCVHSMSHNKEVSFLLQSPINWLLLALAALLGAGLNYSP